MAEHSAELQRGIRAAMLLIAVAVLFGLGLRTLLSRLDTYEHPLAQVSAFAALAAVLAVEWLLIVRQQSWGPWQAPAILLVLAASATSYATLPDGKTSTAVDWAFGTANWVGLIVLLNRPARALVTFLLAHELVAVLHLLLFEDVTRSALQRLATGSVGVLGYPLCAAVLVSALRRFTASTVAARRETERIRTAEAVAEEAHRRRQQRFGELSDTTVPLLEGLADGSLSPEDPTVRRRCAVEAARMRRLFAEIDTVADPLLHELRHCADVADRKGVEVELDSRGRLPALPADVRRDLTDATLTALATASTSARVTVVGTPDMVSVNVVADCGRLDPPRPKRDVRAEVFTAEDTTWLEVVWKPVTEPAPLSRP
ncbi:hypothetical protein [Saccharomonospora sp. NB11]|jgi:hypothetical protein|uniref:hypothetical protein n=1 Tax=Saccharomonospora sp. NB11 TaxID=1642298 RepID=UPI0018D137FD|nr:hypothetical protein [Saccharomonospora sp. NB11]